MTYTYNIDGSIKTRIIAGGPNQTLTYTPQHQTASITDTTGKSAVCTYDASGNLLLQRDTTTTSNSTVTLYLGAEQLTLTTSTGRWHLWHNLGEAVDKTVAAHHACIRAHLAAVRSKYCRPNPRDPTTLRRWCTVSMQSGMPRSRLATLPTYADESEPSWPAPDNATQTSSSTSPTVRR